MQVQGPLRSEYTVELGLYPGFELGFAFFGCRHFVHPRRLCTKNVFIPIFRADLFKMFFRTCLGKGERIYGGLACPKVSSPQHSMLPSGLSVEFRSLSEDFDTSTATGKLQLQMVLAFSEWWRNSIRDRSVAGQAKARAEGRFPGRRPSLTAQQRDYIRVERSKGVSQRELAKLLEVSRWTIQLSVQGFPPR